jgi:hypothetical protein
LTLETRPSRPPVLLADGLIFDVGRVDAERSELDFRSTDLPIGVRVAAREGAETPVLLDQLLGVRFYSFGGSWATIFADRSFDSRSISSSVRSLIGLPKWAIPSSFLPDDVDVVSSTCASCGDLLPG